MPETCQLAKLLGFFRQRAKMSQHHLASVAGLHPSHLSRLERGERLTARRSTVEAIARALLLSPEETGQLLLAAGYTTTPMQLPEGVFGAPSVELPQGPGNQKDVEGLPTPEEAARHILKILSSKDIPEYEKRSLAKQIRSFADWIIAETRKDQSSSERLGDGG